MNPGKKFKSATEEASLVMSIKTILLRVRDRENGRVQEPNKRRKKVNADPFQPLKSLKSVVKA